MNFGGAVPRSDADCSWHAGNLPQGANAVNNWTRPVHWPPSICPAPKLCREEHVEYLDLRQLWDDFYVDTNHVSRLREKPQPNAQGGYDELRKWTGKMMSAEQWAEVHRRHPDVLLCVRVRECPARSDWRGRKARWCRRPARPAAPRAVKGTFYFSWE